jgi:hypothetical protein
MRKVLILFAVAMAGCGRGTGTAVTYSTSQVRIAGEKPRVVQTREEFQKQVIGKSPIEVSDLLGNADKVTTGGGYPPQPTMLRFTRVTKDAKTDRVDAAVEIFFKNGVAERVSFEADPGS